MPPGTLTQGRSRFHQIHGQAQFRIKKAELQSLRDDEAKLAAATSQRNAPFLRKLCTGGCAERLAESGHDNRVQRMEVE